RPSPQLLFQFWERGDELDGRRFMQLDTVRTRELLNEFDFHNVFTDALQWSQPTQRRSLPLANVEGDFQRRQIAQLAGVAVFEITCESDDRIPDARTCEAIHSEVTETNHEN